MFTVEERRKVRERLVSTARSDPEIVAAALVGGSAEGPGDRFSDIDLTLAVRDGGDVNRTVDVWTERMREEFSAAHLFDVSRGPTRYRVFLLPGCLQVDLSFTGAADFRPLGPRFRLLFGAHGAAPPAQPASAVHHVGLAVHHLLRARFSLERGRLWQAAYWIGTARDEVMTAACAVRGLETSNARGFDQLPHELRSSLEPTLVGTLDRAALLHAWAASVDVLGAVLTEIPDLEPRVVERLRELATLTTL